MLLLELFRLQIIGHKKVSYLLIDKILKVWNIYRGGSG